MYESHPVGVIIPAYNEADFVGDVIRDIPEYVDRVYVVEDCSDDETPEAIRTAAEAEATDASSDADRRDNGLPSISELHLESDELAENVDEFYAIGRTVAIHHEENLGAGGAIKTGYQFALEDDTAIVATIDADGQMDPTQLSRFLDPIVAGEADYTKGDRLSNDEHSREMPQFRLFGNSILTLLTRVASGYWEVTDPQNGYTAVRTDVLERVSVEEMYEYYGYLNDLLVRLNIAGADIADVPLPAVYDEEDSHIQYEEYIVNVSQMLLRNFLWRLRVKYPPAKGHPIGLLAAFAGATATAGTVQLLPFSTRLGDADEPRGMVGAVVMYIVAAVSVLLVLAFDRAVHTDGPSYQ
ncbi:glycosyltransferase family 2 protein [Halorubrum halophilum]|uniref:glycosyltransferase family 2 protein n=1 Tax=Halorubrum halophilum TaxID=413816 RepID=UPI000678E883|nr:glycosyltransferase family 2 protein [Halorubrum halophilum]